MIVDYLTDRTEESRPPGGGSMGVYADGPRIPEIAAHPSPKEGGGGRRPVAIVSPMPVLPSSN